MAPDRRLGYARVAQKSHKPLHYCDTFPWLLTRVLSLPLQAINECATVLARLADARVDGRADPRVGAELINQSLKLLALQPNSERGVQIAGCEALTAVLEACKGEYDAPPEAVTRVLAALKNHATSEAVVKAALQALYQLVFQQGLPALAKARSSGAIEAAIGALRAFEGSRVVHETAWQVINWCVSMQPLPRDADVDRVHGPAMRDLVAAGGLDAALRSLGKFPSAPRMCIIMALNMLAGMVHADPRAAEAAGRAKAIEARTNRAHSARPACLILAVLKRPLLSSALVR